MNWAETDVDIKVIDGGWRVKETDTHYIDVLEMIYNFRVAATPKSDLSCYDAGYCYIGRDVGTFMRAVLGANAWDGPGHGDPPGWDKNALTGEWSETASRREATS